MALQDGNLEQLSAAGKAFREAAVKFAEYMFDGEMGHPADEDERFIPIDEDTGNEDVAKALYPLAPGTNETLKALITWPKAGGILCTRD